MLPEAKGTYLLLLETADTGILRVGRQMEMELRPGWYGYIGSAFGPGGLAARLAHHLKRAPRPRWHLDYLRQKARPVEIWFASYDRMTEHRWATLLTEWSFTTLPGLRFGASDCDCRSHLVHFDRLPAFQSMRRRLRSGLVRTVRLHHQFFQTESLTE